MVNWEDGQLIENGYVEINGVKYIVVMPKYSGNTPVTAENLNKMQSDLQLEIENTNEKVEELQTTEDFTSQITFYESIVLAHSYFKKKGNVIYVALQGARKSHTEAEVIGLIPEELRPIKEQVWTPITIDSTPATLYINSSGEITIGSLPSTSVNGRIYANFCYFLD